MSKLSFTDHQLDPGAWAKTLGISKEAVELYLKSEVIDLHVDSFIWHRLWGYDLTKRHSAGITDGAGFGHCDFPRMREAHVTGAMWSITTNPIRPNEQLTDTFQENLEDMKAQFARVPDDYQIVSSYSDFVAARKAGKHAAMIVVQGAQAFQENPDLLHQIPDKCLISITLVHLSNSKIGATSSPLKGPGHDPHLTDIGRDIVARMNQEKMLVDLAHISPEGFWDALEVHDKSQPVVDTHTGVKGVWDHWRNLDDDQIKAIADLNGVIGIMYQGNFLGPKSFGYSLELVLDHMEHILRVAGEDFVALGSDWDGLVVTPKDMKTCLELPRLVEGMLRRGWKPSRVQKILGKNFLRTFKAIRP